VVLTIHTHGSQKINELKNGTGGSLYFSTWSICDRAWEGGIKISTTLTVCGHCLSEVTPPPAPTVLYIFPIVAKHQFPSDHIGPEWFSTHWRTIHPLDAWTPVSIGSHWPRVIQHPLAHHPSTGCLNLLWMNLNLPRAQLTRAGPPSQIDKWINIYDYH
jgi:hypothetical protein